MKSFGDETTASSHSEKRLSVDDVEVHSNLHYIKEPAKILAYIIRTLRRIDYDGQDTLEEQNCQRGHLEERI